MYGNERTEYSSFTQEFRLASSFDGAFNFTLGAFYDDTSMDYARAVRLFTAPPNPARTHRSASKPVITRTNTYSAFAELTYQITPTLDISGGARYSQEDKDTVLQTFFASASTGLPFEMEPIKDEFDGDNTSPQVTCAGSRTRHDALCVLQGRLQVRR